MIVARGKLYGRMVRYTIGSTKELKRTTALVHATYPGQYTGAIYSRTESLPGLTESEQVPRGFWLFELHPTHAPQ